MLRWPSHLVMVAYILLTTFLTVRHDVPLWILLIGGAVLGLALGLAELAHMRRRARRDVSDD